MTVRTRIAPSPTGDPHVGTAYVALFNLCFARQQGGQFILRIEDTDQARSTRQSEDMILKALKWAGLSWDEGPDVGGPFGPYRQSERFDLYAEHAQILLDKGHAFRCFCTTERLGELRQEQLAGGINPGYDGRCADLSAQEVARRLEAGEPNVVRMKVPREGSCVFDDFLRREPIEIAWSQVDMQVLIKSDGMPTYHLANVVDDHHMQITHVLRGEEWISSAPKHLLLYGYFGWEPPVLCHLPLLRNPDRSKLSKRKNPTSILYYQRMGFLPEALTNYLGLMAWSMPDETIEKFTLEDMIAHFDLSRVSLGGPVFDVQKLTWLNERYIREDYDAAGFAGLVRGWALNAEYMAPIIPLIQPRTRLLSDLGPALAFFFAGLLDLQVADFTEKDKDLKKVPQADIVQWLQFSLWALEALRSWEAEAIQETLTKVAEALAIKPRLFNKPIFVATSGGTVSTPLYHSMEILGPDLSRARLRHAIEVLGGVSGKQLKRWEKDFRAIALQSPEASDE